MVFFKGCPLRCPWCSNPESQSFAPEMMGGELIGREITAEEAAAKAVRDRAFFARSGGGVTLSGGEVTAQPEFCAELVRLLKAKNVNVTLETSCYARWENFWLCAQNADVILADVKTMDPAKHRKVIGKSNAPILFNVRHAAMLGKSIIVRVPVIPAFNDDDASLEAIAAFTAAAGIGEMHLLPYHELGKGKYDKLGRPYTLGSLRPPAKETLQRTAEALSKKHGICVRVI